MNILNNILIVSEFDNINIKHYNRKTNASVEMAELDACLNQTMEYVDEYISLEGVAHLLNSDKCTKADMHLADTVSSMEVNIFSIGGAIIKVLYNICKWVLTTIGKIWKWCISFFNRDIKDAKKDIEKIGSVMDIPEMQNEKIGLAVTSAEIIKVSKIIEEHAKNFNVAPSGTPGMKIEDYKTLFFNNFNNAVAALAKVNRQGGWLTPIHYVRSMSIKQLGYTKASDLSDAADKIEGAEQSITSALESLKAQGKDIKKIIDLCETSGYVKNSFIEEKGPGVLDASCICTILVSDLKTLKVLENNFVKMIENINKVSKKYVSAKP